MLRSLALLVLASLFVACQGSHDLPVDLSAEYEAFGDAITPEDAVPVQVVSSEGEALVGKPVKLEGMISEVCQMAGCWMTLQVVDGPMVRIDVPRDEEGKYKYTFPKDASGRRAIVAGTLGEGASHHGEEEGMDHDMGEMDHGAMADNDSGNMDHDAMAEHHTEGSMEHHDSDSDGAMEGHDERETEVLNQSVYTLTATGALLERVRA